MRPATVKWCAATMKASSKLEINEENQAGTVRLVLLLNLVFGQEADCVDE